MKPFAFDPQQLAAIGLSPKDIEDLAQTAQAEIGRETAALASVSGSCDQATAARCAELGCHYGHRSPYWARWTAIQDARGLSLLERLAELSPRGVRWLASWAREAGDRSTFAGAYDYFLHLADRDDVTPAAHENSHYFAISLIAVSIPRFETPFLNCSLAMRANLGPWVTCTRESG